MTLVSGFSVLHEVSLRQGDNPHEASYDGCITMVAPMQTRRAMTGRASSMGNTNADWDYTSGR